MPEREVVQEQNQTEVESVRLKKRHSEEIIIIIIIITLVYENLILNNC